MATKHYYLSGILNWVKAREPDMKFEPAYTLDITLDETSYKAFKDSGAQLKERETEDGIMIKVKRLVSKTVKGETIDLGPPQLLLKNETGGYDKYTGLVGNGSTGTIKLSVYDTMKGKGTELMTIAVDNLVEYDGVEEVGGEDLPF